MLLPWHRRLDKRVDCQLRDNMVTDKCNPLLFIDQKDICLAMAGNMQYIIRFPPYVNIITLADIVDVSPYFFLILSRMLMDGRVSTTLPDKIIEKLIDSSKLWFSAGNHWPGKLMYIYGKISFLLDMADSSTMVRMHMGHNDMVKVSKSEIVIF